MARRPSVLFSPPLLLFAGLLSLLADPVCGEGAPRPSLLSRLELSLGASGLLGLEAPLRALRLEFGLGLGDGLFLPALRLGLEGDAGLAAFLLEGSLALSLGPGLELRLRETLPLARPRLGMGGGRSLLLTAPGLPALPNGLGLTARLGELELPLPGLGLELLASFDFQSWMPERALSLGAPTAFRRGDALAAYSAGFKAGLGLRLVLRPFAGRRRARIVSREAPVRSSPRPRIEAGARTWTVCRKRRDSWRSRASPPS